MEKLIEANEELYEAIRMWCGKDRAIEILNNAPAVELDSYAKSAYKEGFKKAVKHISSLTTRYEVDEYRKQISKCTTCKQIVLTEDLYKYKYCYGCGYKIEKETDADDV